MNKSLFKRINLIAAAVLLLMVSCESGEEEKKRYEGFSKLVQERRELNEQIKQKNLEESKTEDSEEPDDQKKSRRKYRYAEDVVVKKVSDGEVIVYGRAFFDDKGRLINIKITHDK